MDPLHSEAGLPVPPLDPSAELVEQFESAWRGGSAPTLVDFLTSRGFGVDA